MPKLRKINSLNKNKESPYIHQKPKGKNKEKAAEAGAYSFRPRATYIVSSLTNKTPFVNRVAQLRNNYNILKLDKSWIIRDIEECKLKNHSEDIELYYKELDYAKTIKNIANDKSQSKKINDKIYNARSIRNKKLYPTRYPKYFPFSKYKVGTVSIEMLCCFLISLKQNRSLKYYQHKQGFKQIKNNNPNIYNVPENEDYTKSFMYSNNPPIKFIMDWFMNHIKILLELDENYICIPGIIITIKESIQELHLDFAQLTDSEDYPWILHMPLCREGMWLNIMSIVENDEKSVFITPCRIHIPFTQYLIIRGDVVHGGIFGQPGNIRIHIVFKHAGLDGSKLYEISKENKNFPTAEACSKNNLRISSIDRGYIPSFLQHYKNSSLEETIFDNLTA